MASSLELRMESRPLGDGTARCVFASGEVDLSNADELRGALDPESTERGLVLDLSEIAFMDSSGLAVVLGAVETLGPRLVLVLPEGSPVARLLEMTESSGWVTSAPSVEAALGVLEGSDAG
jgi:anti-sigma B factor antagonist